MVDCRPRDPEDQIERPAGKPRPNDLHGPLDLGAPVIALQNAEQAGLERLGAEADAIHASSRQNVGFLSVKRAGICLDRPLAAGRQDQPSRDHCRQPRKLLGVQPCRRSTADEYRVNLPRLTQRVHQLGFERGQVTIGQVVSTSQRSKVAVSALVGAERDMDVSRTRPQPPGLSAG